MFKVYFKQAIQMLKQNKFISIISIVGTALAIMMIMTIVVVHEMKTLSVDPEPYRNRTLYIVGFMRESTENKGTMAGSLNLGWFPDLLEMQTPESITLLSSNNSPVNAEGQEGFEFAAEKKATAGFWDIYPLKFTEGRPFTREEVESEVKVAVLSESLARKLYGGTSPLGKGFVCNFVSYRVIGVVKDVSKVFTDAYADCWTPFTGTHTGNLVLLARNRRDFPAIIEEARGIEEKYGIENPEWKLTLFGPHTKAEEQMGWRYLSTHDSAKMIRANNRQQIFILLVLLLVPALNLSGFSLSRVKKRMAEIGIRKAFGAKRGTILAQILYENMITSLLGGLVGLGLSYVVLLNFRHWLLGVPAGNALPVNVMVSPVTWLAVFLVCFLLNLLSAGLPAWRAARMTIIHSIYQNEKT